MSEEQRKVEQQYGGKVRLRVCGILGRPADGAILCALHKGVGPLGELWVPPGGGVELGESLAHCLQREFLEETSLKVGVGSLVGVYEYIALPLHAVELFYRVTLLAPGTPTLGADPEWPLEEPPLLAGLDWFTAEQVAALGPELFHKAVLAAFAEADQPETN